MPDEPAPEPDEAPVKEPAAMGEHAPKRIPPPSPEPFRSGL